MSFKIPPTQPILGFSDRRLALHKHIGDACVCSSSTGVHPLTVHSKLFHSCSRGRRARLNEQQHPPSDICCSRLHLVTVFIFPVGIFQTHLFGGMFFFSSSVLHFAVQLLLSPEGSNCKITRYLALSYDCSMKQAFFFLLSKAEQVKLPLIH